MLTFGPSFAEECTTADGCIVTFPTMVGPLLFCWRIVLNFQLVPQEEEKKLVDVQS